MMVSCCFYWLPYWLEIMNIVILALTVIPTDWTAGSLNGLFVITMRVCVNAGVTVKECDHVNTTSSQQGHGKKASKREMSEKE